jgi:hypothetical protein
MKGALFGHVAAIVLMSSAAVSIASAAPAITYVPGSLAQSVITKGPWPLHETTSTKHYNHDASGITPGGPGDGTPYADYCSPTTGRILQNQVTTLMQPYYFPFVQKRKDGNLVGYFDYRPRNEQEAMVMAISTDLGRSWAFKGEALRLNPYCPADPTDPNNNNVLVGGVSTPYGSDSTSAADNGLGHPVVLTIGGVTRAYQLDRANNHIDSDQLVIHTLGGPGVPNLSTLPAYGFVSPLGSGGYPGLDAQATHTTGLINPDAIMGSVKMGSTTVVVYVSKTLNGDLSFPSNEICPKTPSFALTNLVNGKKRSTNDDVTLVRVATTTDGVNFTDLGTSASGLNDPTTVALNGTRYLGSGSIIKLSDGRYGMFFGAGNCLDNDSDGFHYMGYAETTNPVSSASDLLSWTIVNGLDNPILSTDRVGDTSQTPTRVYPANAPVVDVSSLDALTAAQVAPFVPPTAAYEPPGGYDSNFFSGRVYDPQASYTDSQTVTIVFAGYNTPQPSNNLGDYRTIGRFQLQFPAGYVAPN